MITNLDAFKRDLKHFSAVTVPHAHLALQKKIAIRLHKKIVEKSSQSGRSTADWRCSLGKRPGHGNNSSILLKILVAAVPGGIIWLYTSNPHNIELVHGDSTLAPEGILEDMIDDVEASIAEL